ncbi:nucleotidyl transferase AbiEii/AbiGii toxin family protein [Thermoflexus hugenholtzii]
MLKGKGLLTPAQKEALILLATLPDQEHFYLTGGTALAEFYLGHRISFDLDLFTTQEGLVGPFSQVLERRFREKEWGVKIIRRFATFVEMLLEKCGEEIRLDLALDAPFRFAPPLLSEYGVLVNVWEDLKAEKPWPITGVQNLGMRSTFTFCLKSIPWSI